MKKLSEGQWWDWVDQLKGLLCATCLWESCSEPGMDASDAVKSALKDSDIEAHVATLEDYTRLVQELKETGAWDVDELADPEENLARFVWMKACDIREEQEGEQS